MALSRLNGQEMAAFPGGECAGANVPHGTPERCAGWDGKEPGWAQHYRFSVCLVPNDRADLSIRFQVGGQLGIRCM